MKIYLAGTAPFPELTQRFEIPYLLESFYYFKDWQLQYMRGCKDFLLDSGAFTFMQAQKKIVVWEDYVEQYAYFIKKNKIQKYFELDIDSVVGYKKVVEYRKRLEAITGSQCIPVWHKGRGFGEFEQMCDEYSYVAIGGIVAGEIKQKDYPIFTPMIKKAHKLGAKIHGLGFTSIRLLPKYHFDSVDSTSWTSGCRFGSAYRFNNGRLDLYKGGHGQRAKRELTNENNLSEWIKFQKYAEVYL